MTSPSSFDFLQLMVWFNTTIILVMMVVLRTPDSGGAAQKLLYNLIYIEQTYYPYFYCYITLYLIYKMSDNNNLSITDGSDSERGSNNSDSSTPKRRPKL